MRATAFIRLTRIRAIGIFTAAICANAFAQESTTEVNLSALDGTNGFVIKGIYAHDASGRSVSGVGDINNDGFTDIIVGAFRAGSVNGSATGQSYVLFGGQNVGGGGLISLSSLSGENGFVINGVERGDSSGKSVSDAGDINGDGIPDLIIGAPHADADGVSVAGKTYVVFGAENIGSEGVLNLSALSGTNGFVINGINPLDFFGEAVSAAGDFNDDGFDDLIIGASNASFNEKKSGASYVIFGGENVGKSGHFDLASLDGKNGFIFTGSEEGDHLGIAVSSAGDVNNDGYADLIIGASNASSLNIKNSGRGYVIFGNAEIIDSGILSTSELNGENGFALNGIASLDELGWSVSGTGDINGDSIDDFLLGAARGGPNELSNAGEAYAIFGSESIGASGSIDLSGLNGKNGFVIQGENAVDQAGWSLSQGGDINGDDLSDFIISAVLADSNTAVNAGKTYVIFGNKQLGSSKFKVSEIDGSNGFVLNGIDASDLSGWSVSSAGDINSDGFSDVLIGAGNTEANGIVNAGESYVVFGFSASVVCHGLPITVYIANGDVPTNSDDVILGTSGADTINGLGGNDTICGLGGDDTINGGEGDDYIDAGVGDDSVFGRDGNDTLIGGVGKDLLNGFLGDDTILANDGAQDTVNGGPGEDVCMLDEGDTFFKCP